MSICLDLVSDVKVPIEGNAPVGLDESLYIQWAVQDDGAVGLDASALPDVVCRVWWRIGGGGVDDWS